MSESDTRRSEPMPEASPPIPGAVLDPSSTTASLIAGLIVLAGVANNARSLGWGFQYDDFVHQAVLRGLVHSDHLRPWSLYDFGVRPLHDSPFAQRGFLPWWTDPEFKVRFFRPVTSVSIFVDYMVWRDWAPGYHITSLTLFGALLALTYRLYRNLGVPAPAALWSLAFLAFEDSAVVPVGWIANRNTLLAALFVVATILMIHRYRRSANRWYLFAAVACFALACGSKESGLVAMPIVALYLFLFDGPSATGARLVPSETALAACRRTARSPVLWGFAVLACVYVAGYVLAGYGTRAGQYATPWLDTGEYLYRLAVLVPLGLANLLLGLPTDILFGRPQWIAPAVGIAVPLLLAVLVIVARALRGSRPAAFAIGWALLSFPPEAGVDLFDRLFLGAGVGTALLMGLFVGSLLPLRERIASRRYASLALGAFFILSDTALSIVGTAARSIAWNALAASDRSAAANAELDRPPPPGQTAILVNGPSSMLGWSFLPTWSVLHADSTTRAFALQFGRRPLVWTRDGDRTMTLTSESSPFLSEHFERLFFGRQPMPSAGTTYETAECTATVMATEPGGVRTVRFEFQKSLDDPLYRFLAWQDGRLARMVPPAVGATIRLPAVPKQHPVAP